jgi:hypothetical protein
MERDAPLILDPALPPQPLHTDWAWRGGLWSDPMPLPAGTLAGGAEVGPGCKLFHDDPSARITMDRPDAGPEAGSPPFPVAIEVADFSGSFLSLAVDLAPGAVAGFRRRQLVRAQTLVEASAAREIYIRLNIRAAANTERLPQTIRPGESETLEFDLFHAQFFEGAVEAAWVDLIFTAPAPGRIVIRDLVLSRRPRPGL